MKNYFIVSLCKNGLLGGGIAAQEHAITYRTGKVTVSQKYRNLEMKYENILSVSSGWLLFLPTVTIHMRDGEEYRFVVFAKKRFLERLRREGVGQ